MNRKELVKLVSELVARHNGKASYHQKQGIGGGDMHFDDWWQIEKHREKMQEEYETFFKLVRDEILLPEQAADRLHISLREFRERFDAVSGRGGVAMVITEEVLETVVWDCVSGRDLSKKRLKELQELAIKSPSKGIYGRDIFVPEKADFVSGCGERILYTCAFSPHPMYQREEPGRYKDVYLLILDEAYFELYWDDVEYIGDDVGDFGERFTILDDGRKLKHWRYTLRPNEKLDQREDLYRILKLLKRVVLFESNETQEYLGKNMIKIADIIYKGVTV